MLLELSCSNLKCKVVTYCWSKRESACVPLSVFMPTPSPLPLVLSYGTSPSCYPRINNTKIISVITSVSFSVYCNRLK